MYLDKIQSEIKEINQSINSLNLKKKKCESETEKRDAQLDRLKKENEKVVAGYNNDNGLSHFLTLLSLITSIWIGVEIFRLVRDMFILFALAIAFAAGFVAIIILVSMFHSIVKSRYKEDYLKYNAEKESLEAIDYQSQLSEIDNELTGLNNKLKALKKDLHYADLYDMSQDDVEKMCKKYARIKLAGASSEYAKEVISTLEDALMALDVDGKYTATDILSTACEDDDAPILEMLYKVAYSGSRNGGKELKNYIYDQENWITGAIKRGNYTDAIERATALLNAGDPVAQDLLDLAKKKRDDHRSSSVNIDAIYRRMKQQQESSPTTSYEIVPLPDVTDM